MSILLNKKSRTGIIWLSAITNVLVMGVTSEQLKEVFPSFFDDHGDTHDPRKSGVVLLVVLEHALLAARLAITFGFRSVRLMPLRRSEVTPHDRILSTSLFVYYLSIPIYVYINVCRHA